MHLIITGGTSYIGRRLVQMALRQGHGVTLLGTDRPIPGMQAAVPWRLGEPIPERARSPPADAVIHLAHIWHATGAENDDTNLIDTTAGAPPRKPGADVHYAGPLAMGMRSDRFGEVKGAPGLHAGRWRGACRAIPARNPTLTIMANADRIGTALAAAWRALAPASAFTPPRAKPVPPAASRRQWRPRGMTVLPPATARPPSCCRARAAS